MSRPQAIPVRLGLAWGLSVALLVGCAARAPGVAPDGQRKDIVTASDESDASKRARVRMELAAGYFGRGQMTAALDQVKLAIVAEPTLGEAFNLRGLIYANLGEERLAEDSFRHALQLNAHDADTMQNFGYYLCQKKRYAEATTLFDQALAEPQYRDSSRTLLTKGVCQAFAGNLLESEATLTRAYELDPANPSTAVNLSEVLFRRGEYERARFYVRRVNNVPALQGAQTLWLAARIEQRLGNRTGAKELGDQLRKRFPDSREAAFYERGQFDE
jgi:type IV pilus assembly protein PilF